MPCRHRRGAQPSREFLRGPGSNVQGCRVLLDTWLGQQPPPSSGALLAQQASAAPAARHAGMLAAPLTEHVRQAHLHFPQATCRLAGYDICTANTAGC